MGTTARPARRGYRWDVFVSHNRQQKGWVRLAVGQWRDLGLQVFFDEENIEPGEEVVQGIERGLTASRHVVLIITPTAVSSRWVALETALTLWSDPNGRDKRLIPVLLEPTAEEQIRPVVNRLNRVDLTDPDERANGYHRLLRFLTGRKSGRLPEPPPWDAAGGALARRDPPAPEPADAEDDRSEQIELHIDREFDEFTPDEQDRILSAVRELLRVTGSVRVVSQRRGSVVLTLELPARYASRLFWAVQAGELAEFGVTDARTPRPALAPDPGWATAAPPAADLGSVSAWLSRLNRGDGAALGQLYDRYWPFLVTLARKSLRRAADPAELSDEVAQSALVSVYRRLGEGQLPRMANRGELVHTLTTAVTRKVVQAARRERAVGGSGHRLTLGRGREQPPARGPSPEEAAVFQDLYGQFVGGLDPQLRRIAEMKLAGYTAAEVALEVGIAVRAVERKVELIQTRWEALMRADAPDATT